MDGADKFNEALAELAAAAHALAEKWAEATETLAADLERACQSVREAWEQITAMDVDVDTTEAPRKKTRQRPPRYAGPQNKGRQWNRQPPRLARSDCRKMRR